jgi:hypothetical protein
MREARYAKLGRPDSVQASPQPHWIPAFAGMTEKKQN